MHLRPTKPRHPPPRRLCHCLLTPQIQPPSRSSPQCVRGTPPQSTSPQEACRPHLHHFHLPPPPSTPPVRSESTRRPRWHTTRPLHSSAPRTPRRRKLSMIHTRTPWGWRTTRGRSTPLGKDLRTRRPPFPKARNDPLGTQTLLTRRLCYLSSIWCPMGSSGRQGIAPSMRGRRGRGWSRAFLRGRGGECLFCSMRRRGRCPFWVALSEAMCIQRRKERVGIRSVSSAF